MDLLPTQAVAAEEEKLFEEVVVRVTRTAKVVSGGKRMSFSALAVVGNRAGKVGWGYGKAGEVPFAVEKAIRNAKRNILKVPLAKSHTLPHSIEAKYKSTRVWLGPASLGTGLKCGAAVRAVLEYAGVKDALSKIYGSANSLNAVKAAFTALRLLRSKHVVETLRGVRLAGPSPSPYSGVIEHEPAAVPSTEPEQASVQAGLKKRGRDTKPRVKRDVKGPRERVKEPSAASGSEGKPSPQSAREVKAASPPEAVKPEAKSDEPKT